MELQPDFEKLAADVAAGDVRTLSRALTWIESRAPGADELLAALFERRQAAWRIGVTGAPGVDPAWSRIVGIVPQVRHMQLEERAEQSAFYRLDATPVLSRGRAILVVRSSMPGTELARIAREHAGSVGLRATDVASLDRRMRDSLSDRISLMGLVVSLISDLIYTWVDPRIDFERRDV